MCSMRQARQALQDHLVRVLCVPEELPVAERVVALGRLEPRGPLAANRLVVAAEVAAVGAVGRRDRRGLVAPARSQIQMQSGSFVSD